jgi:hypothetical protein
MWKNLYYYYYYYYYLFIIPEIHQSGYRTCHYIIIGRVQKDS